MSETVYRHEQIKAACMALYGEPCGADLDAVDLDDYADMPPNEAAEAIVAAAAEARREKAERERA